MRRSRIGTRPILLLAAALALTFAPPAVMAAADPPPLAPGTLVKSVQNVTDPGSNPADHGDVVNWVMSYDDPGAGGSVTVTDPIGSGQALVPGSLKVPPDWVRSWSTDGTTFSTTEPGSGTVAVRATNPDLQPGGTSLTRLLLPPVQPTTTATGGDGFTPVLYRSANGAIESWNVYHHLVTAAPKVVCINLLTAQPCAGGPWPRPLNSTPGPLGAGSTGDLGSPMAPKFVFDPQRPGVVYFPAHTAAALGVACLDLDARANCGFFPLTPTGGSPSASNNIAGLEYTNGNLYAASTNGSVLCLTMSTRTPCAGQPYTGIVAPHSDTAPNTNMQFYGSTTLADGKIFISSSPTSGAKLACFDPATNSACTGWAAPKAAGPAGLITYGVFTTYTTTGDEEGVCVPPAGGVYQLHCYTIAGASLTPPAFPALPNGTLTFNPKVITGPDGHLRSYFPFWGGPILGATGCWDWNTGAACAGMAFPKTHPGVGGSGATRDYGYDYDEAGECLLGLGDAGLLFSMDPITGASPCFRAGASLTLTTPDFYCDGASGHITGYQDARLVDIDIANIDLANSAATISKPDNTVIATLPFAADGSVDLSGISPSTHPALVIEASLRLLNVDDFGGGNEPHLVAGFDGDPPQICFQTKLSSDCGVYSVSNTATGTDAGGALTSNTVQQPINPGAACQPNIAVNKEICKDTRASRCGPGGVGPWGKSSPAGLLGVLGTAYWRITVTNTGPVDAVGVTVNDSVAPGCVTAGGTFTLAAGASKQIHCSTFLLLLPLVNTASVNYSAAGAPQGTPPTTSGTSSATACSLLCILGSPDRAQELRAR
ncbi:DUF11 domain-containing protein [Catellatospora vulcania]|uniref:DUF11 domain-containing protein n=1 Tax=Catellatospora vulcania TaxID=1460450 RepID=UPI001E658209|nr:DUF11 domain-containing protein [Catellatospora vulcania]